MKKMFLLPVLMLLTLASFAQSRGRITGSVVDGSQKTIESATIALLRAKDSSTVKYAVAGKTGSFQFESIPAGRYLVLVTAVGHQKTYSPQVELTDTRTEVALSTLELIPVPKSMGGVVVTAKKPLIEQKIDRTVVNVEAAVTNAGASAMEVLEKSPGISVDKDGNISLKGKEGVLVLVDGRPTQLSGTDLANLLKTMNANQLDQIEIMTNPPARYDAAGNAGIINIKTKKNKQNGYNGSVTLGWGQSRLPKFNEAVNMNYKSGRFNLFTNLSHNYRTSFNELDINRNLLNANTKVLEKYFDQEARMKNTFNSYNAKIGADFFATKRTTYGIVFNGFSNPGTFSNRNRTIITDPNHDLLSDTRASVDNEQTWKNFSTNLNYRTLLDTTGKELTADLDYVTYNSKNTQDMINSYFNGSGAPLAKADTLMGNLPQDIRIYSGRIDYLMPLKKGRRFEAGAKSSLVKTDNNARYDSLQYGQVIPDLGRSNYFIYEENINAVYANYSTPLSKKFSAQLGLRLENTNAKGNQKTTGENFTRNYTQLFPTAYLQYKANEQNSFVLNYGRRVRRPNYESLNPFIKFLDRYTYQQGNPNLRPQLSDNIELSHTYKNVLTTTLNYSRTTDIIQNVIEQQGEEAFIRNDNIANARQFGIAISANMPVNKWWTSSLYVNLFNNRFEGVVSNAPVTISATMIALNGSQQFKLGKKLTAEVSGFVRTGGIEGVIRGKGMGMLNAGFSYPVMKNNGTLRLGVRDILWTNRMRATTKYGNVDAAFREVRDTRVVNLGFTYRFAKGKVASQRRRAGSANDEQSRVGVGN